MLFVQPCYQTANAAHVPLEGAAALPAAGPAAGVGSWRGEHRLECRQGIQDQVVAVIAGACGLRCFRIPGQNRTQVERLTDVAIDQPLDDELFHFTPPQGVRVDDLLAPAPPAADRPRAAALSATHAPPAARSPNPYRSRAGRRRLRGGR